MNQRVILSIFLVIVSADKIYAQEVQKTSADSQAQQKLNAAQEKSLAAAQVVKKTEELKKSSSEIEKKDAAQKAAVETNQKTEEEKKKSEQAALEAQKKAEEEKLVQAKKEAQEKEAQEKAREQKMHEEKIAQEKAATARASEESKKTAATKQGSAQEGIDTLELEGGNWLLKRQALEKTVDLIEQINNYFTKILEARIDFLVKRNATDRDFDGFVSKIGFEMGDLSRLLNDLLDTLNRERKELGDLTPEERVALQEIDEKTKELKALQEEINNAIALTNSLDDVIMKLEQEVTIANTYQANAWKNFQAIKKVLNDEKAEELYLETQGLLKNIQAVDEYLKGKLLDYFKGIIRNIAQSIKKIEDAVQGLSLKGINLKEEVDKFVEGDKKRFNADKCEQIQEAKKSKEETQKKVTAQKKSQQGWLEWFGEILYYPVSLIQSLWHSAMNLIASENEVIVARKKSVESSEVKTASASAKTNK